jgi:hypothetical protein
MTYSVPLPVESDTHPRVRWFDEISREKSSIVVTAGDSWTWGDSLGPESGDDRDYRMNHVYGSLIAKKLDRDFLNISKPAGTNAEIHDKLIYAMPYLQKKYKKIDVIICLTELAREIHGDPLWVQQDLNEYLEVDTFLHDYERTMFASFKKELIDQYPNVNFVLCRNFTYSYTDNIPKNHTEKTWMDIIEDMRPQENAYPQDVRILSTMSYVPIIKTLKSKGVYSKLKFTMMEQMASSELAEIWMRNNPMQSNKGTRHPLEQGHSAWADYLMPYLS